MNGGFVGPCEQGAGQPFAAENGFQIAGCVACKYSESWPLVPEESERTTGVSGMFGRLRPGLSARIDGSCQLVTWPVKIFAIVPDDSRRFVMRRPVVGSTRLYMNDVPPATSGMYWYVRNRSLSSAWYCASSSGWYGISVAAKSTRLYM